MINVGDAVVKITGDTSQLNSAMAEAGQSVSNSAKKMQDGLKMAGVAFTAMGVAGLAMIQSTKEINANLGVTGLNLGVTTKEMRDLTLATTDVTFPIKEVVKSFDLLARAGVKDTEVLKEVALAFDALSDAIGSSASEVTAVMIPAMKTFRLSAEEIAKKTDLMTYMVRNSTTSLEDFNTMVGYTTQDMVSAGLTIEDMAAAMMYMSDMGVAPGRVMLREWNNAVTQSQKEGIALTEALGMTSEELKTYKDNMAGATGITQIYADAANDQFTIMDKLKQKWEELTLSASSFLEPLEPILALMTALGPIMILAGTSAGTAAIKWGIHTVALVAHKIAALASAAANLILHASLGPVGWAIVAATTAIIAGITYMAIFRDTALGTADAVDDLSKAALINRLKMELTAEEWKIAERDGYLLQEQIDRVAEAMGVTSNQFLEAMDASELLHSSWRQGTINGGVYTLSINGISEALVQEAETAKRAQEAIVTATIQGAIDAATAEKASLDERIDYYREKAYERIDIIDEVTLAEIESFNSVASAQLGAINEQIGALDAAGAARREAADEARLQDMLALRDDEEIAKTRTQSQSDALDRQIADMEASLERRRLIQEKNNIISGLAMEEFLEQQKSAIDTKMGSLESAYAADAEAFASYNQQKIEEVGRFIDAWNELMSATSYGEQLPGEIGPFGPIKPHAAGGIITSPTWLTKVGSMSPYGIMAEAGPERIVPEGGQFKTATIIVQLDGRTIAQVIGEPLVDIIRLDQGLKL